ncbi:hypothetical protein N7517_006342 [Penicillium concentricum]|uniref:Uncharacterized protein n=1 Tax=Penicillium concentricum TaxID=293559 RepID=A0A9W9VCF4_9EURO|nr:uncharacterized protein N7517_006342 [Penicillium concentricum]KAJ5374336.1 hypothetical protein N7517_006342 [Penicillium concentricum]
MTAPARDASATQSDQVSDYDAAGEKLRSEITSVGVSTFSPTVPLIGGEGRDPIEQDSNSANPWEPAPTVRDDLSFDFDPMLLWPLAENGLDYAGKPAFQMQLSAVNMSFDGQHESNQELPDAPGMLLTASQFQNQEPNHRRNRLALEEKPHPELSEADLDILASEDSFMRDV